jgi:hypothetical protein
MAQAAAMRWGGLRFYFVDSVGFGTCDNCGEEGSFKMLCLTCCKTEGMVLEARSVCNNCSPVWKKCEGCNWGQYVPPVYDCCDSCGEQGPVGVRCDGCRDGDYVVDNLESD